MHKAQANMYLVLRSTADSIIKPIPSVSQSSQFQLLYLDTKKLVII
jgi:hypothetical protein